MRSRETDQTPETTRRVLVIGYGNPLRGDDGLGQVIAARIAETARPEAIGVIVAHQLTPELAEPISRSDLVIFVDAAVNLPAGRIKVVPVLPDALDAPATLGHHCGPAQLLAAAQRVYGHGPEAWAIVVGGASWDYAESLSPAVERLVPRLLHYIELLIAVRFRAEAGHA